MTVFVWIGGVIALVYIVMAVLLFVVQRRLIYPAPPDGAAGARWRL